MIRLLTLASAILTVPLAVISFAQTLALAARQLSGPSEFSDFVAFYTGARLLLEHPSRLYDQSAWSALQADLHGGAAPLMQFWSPPQVALLVAPLALLPFGVAYVAWLSINLACLVIACALLAPRGVGARWWLPAAVLSALFLPVQLGLLMGQLCFVLLVGFAAFVRLATHAGSVGTALSLLSWTLKPQLLPALLVSLGLTRRWPLLALACSLLLLVCLPVVLLGGPRILVDYAGLAHYAGNGLVTGQGTHLIAGECLLGVAQWLLGPGLPATALGIVGAIVTLALIGTIWRQGLQTDARRHIQLAMLPVAALLASPHALPYDATLWLATAWLLMNFASEVPHARRAVLTLLFAGFWGGNLATLPILNTIAPWGALFALLALAAMWRLYQASAPQAPSAAQV